LIIFLLGISLGVTTHQIYSEYKALEFLKVEVVNAQVRIGADDVKTIEIAITLNFTNPSKVQTQISSDFQIYLSKVYIGDGHLPDVRVAAGGSKLEQVYLHIDSQQLALSIISTLLQGEFELVIDGVLRTRLLFGLVPISRHFSAVYSYP